jgi:glycosyltransferase involved in cell wall biosynthesis
MIVLDDEARIGRALGSVRWADEIVVIDGGSRDATARIAESMGARVEVRPWPGDFAVQLRHALAAARCEWIFRLDSDETVTAELAAQIRDAVAKPAGALGYRVRRKNYFLGRWIRHGGWWPDPQIRLVKREVATVRGGPVHESLFVPGPILDLTGALEHDTHPTIESSLQRLVRYSKLMAPERARRKRISAVHLVVHPWAAFLRKYFVLSGWRDGVHGYLIAVIHAMVKFAVYAQAWEIQRRGNETSAPAAREERKG